MGQQRNKVEKRTRRANYLKRLKSRAALGLTKKKRVTAAKGEAKAVEPKEKAAKKKVVKKKVAKKKVAAKVADAPVVETSTPVAEDSSAE